MCTCTAHPWRPRYGAYFWAGCSTSLESIHIYFYRYTRIYAMSHSGVGAHSCSSPTNWRPLRLHMRIGEIQCAFCRSMTTITLASIPGRLIRILLIRLFNRRMINDSKRLLIQMCCPFHRTIFWIASWLGDTYDKSDTWWSCNVFFCEQTPFQSECTPIGRTRCTTTFS